MATGIISCQLLCIWKDWSFDVVYFISGTLGLWNISPHDFGCMLRRTWLISFIHICVRLNFIFVNYFSVGFCVV